MPIFKLEENGLHWNKTIDFANSCSWKAGPFLAKQMCNREFTDWERIFIATSDNEITGYCTLSKKDCIPNVDYTPYISFVFVGEPYRGHRLSEQLIIHASKYAKTLGFEKVYLVSGEYGLYEKYDFIKIEDTFDVWGNKEQIFYKVL